jgi:hypothetical protein
LTASDESITLLDFAFGPEPARNWCFYYQKAELARQQGDWEMIAKIGTEVENLRIAPKDLIEWTPFLQAHAYLGQADKVEGRADYFKDDSFHNQQLCKNLNRMNENDYPLQPNMQAKVDALFFSDN